MKTLYLSLTAVVLAGLVSAPALLQEKGGDDRTGPYDVAQGWPQPLAFAKPGYIWGSTGGIFAETSAQGQANFSGTWKLTSTDPPVPARRGGGGGGGGTSGPYAATMLAQAPDTMTLAQNASTTRTLKYTKAS